MGPNGWAQRLGREPGPGHWSVAVLDEIQLLSDEQRGMAWTRALLGAQAEHLHLCGANEPSLEAELRLGFELTQLERCWRWSFCGSVGGSHCFIVSD